MSARATQDRPADLSEVWATARHAGSIGMFSRFCEGHAHASRLAALIGSDVDLFRAGWRDLIEFLFDVGDVGEGLRSLRLAAELGFDDVAALPLLHELQRLFAAYPQVFERGRTLVLDTAQGHRVAPVEDVRLVGWMRLNNPASQVPIYARNAWLTIMAELLRAADREKLSCALVPEYLAPFIGPPRATTRTLSFHTAGVSTGVMHFKPGDLPDYVVLDSGGYSGWSSLSGRPLASLDLAPLVVAEEFFERHRSEVLRGNVSKYTQKSVSGRGDLPLDYVFVAMQVATDRTQVLADVPMLDMLDIVVARFRGTSTRVVVKRHPMCRSDAVATRLTQLAACGAILLSEESIHPLIAGSRAVIAVNSGVGSEAIVHLKPIYLFGASDYDAVAHRVRSAEEFVALTNPIGPAVALADYKRFLHYYRTQYQVDIRDRRRVSRAVSSFLASGDRCRDGAAANTADISASAVAVERPPELLSR